jgi:hypothetical protein
MYRVPFLYAGRVRMRSKPQEGETDREWIYRLSLDN